MLRQVIVDTSILIAIIDQRDQYHDWAREQLGESSPPLLTCEAVISETWFLLRRVRNGREALLLLLEQERVSVEFNLSAEQVPVIALMRRYRSVPASVADAELVRMAELHPNSSVFTLDSDFQIYRKNRDTPIPLLMP
ncbi:MAG: PIN domain-containing protein [Cyanobacteria bacterium J06635_11]